MQKQHLGGMLKGMAVKGGVKMLTITYKNKRYYISLARLKRRIKTAIVELLIITAVTIPLVHFTIDAIQHPELYITTMRAQLQRDIKAGNAEAIDYYSRTYELKGINLFDE